MAGAPDRALAHRRMLDTKAEARANDDNPINVETSLATSPRAA